MLTTPGTTHLVLGREAISVKSIILSENINDLIFWENKCRINSDFYNKVMVNKCGKTYWKCNCAPL